MLCRYNFWARALGVPTCLALCAYLISISHFAPRSIVVYLLLLFLLLVDITSLVPERVRAPFVVLGALVLGLCLIEGAAVTFVHTPVSIQQKGLLARDSILGWRNGNPGVYSDKRIDSNSGATIYYVRYTIDENRLRKTISSDHGPTVAFLGDSFTFGLGVKDADTMPQAFADLTDHKIRILNLGVEGYSPAQFLRAMETGVFDKVIGPKPSLFVFLTSPWQSSRVACKLDFVAGAPRYILDENGKPVFAGVCRVDHGKFVQELLSHVTLFPVLFQRLYQVGTRADLKLYVAETLEAAALARERYHVPTIVLFVAAGYRNLWLSGFSDQDILDQLRAGGVPVIDASLSKNPADDPKLGIAGDGHPTPFAHHTRAILLKQYLVTNIPQTISATH